MTIFLDWREREKEIINENRFICWNTDFEMGFDERDVEEDWNILCEKKMNDFFFPQKHNPFKVSSNQEFEYITLYNTFIGQSGIIFLMKTDWEEIKC